MKGGGGRGGRVVTIIGRLVVVGHLGSFEPGKQTTGGLTGGGRVVGGVGGGGHPGKSAPGKQGLWVNCGGHLGSSGLKLQLGMLTGGLVVVGHL